MADRYWVGGAGTWSNLATTNWSTSSGGSGGASAPAVTDDVFFDVNSNVGTGAFTVTANGGNCRNCTISGLDGVMTLAFGTSSITCEGDWSSPATNFTTTATTGYLNFQNATSALQTITTNGVTLNCQIWVNRINSLGTVQLNDALTIANTLNHLRGTLDLNGFTLSCRVYLGSYTNIRAITFGSSNIVLTSTAASTTVLSMAIVTGFTWTGTGGFVRNQAATATVVFGTTGGSVSNAPNLSVNAGASTLTMTSNSWFKALDFTGSTCTVNNSSLVTGINIADVLTLSTGGTYTGFNPNFRVNATLDVTASLKVLGSFEVSGAGITVSLARDTTTTTTGATYLTEGTLDLNGFSLSTGTFFASNSNARAVSFGSSSITLSSVSSATTVLSVATATNFTWTGTGGFVRNQANTATVSFGSVGGSVSNAPNLSVTGASTLSVSSGSWFKTLDFTGSTCTVNNSTLGTGINIAGVLTLSTGGTYTGFHPSFRVTATLDVTSTPKTLGRLTIDGTGITVSLARNTTVSAGSTGITTLTAGTLDLNGFDLTTQIFSSTNSNVRSVVFGSNSIVISIGTAGITAISMATATNFTWTGTGGFVRSQIATATFLFGGTAGGSAANAINLTINAGAGAPTLTGFFNNVNFTGSTCTVSSSPSIAGDLTLATGGTYTAFNPTFINSGTVTSVGKTLGNTTVDASGATVTLADAMTLAATNSFTLTTGTLNLAGFNLTTGTFVSNNSATRDINFGTGDINLITTTAAVTALNIASATNFTWTGTGGFVRNQAATATFRLGTTGGTASNAVNLTINAGSATPTIEGYYNNLDFTGSSCTVTSPVTVAGNLTLSTGGDYTGMGVLCVDSGALASVGKAINNIRIDAAGATVTLADAMALTSNTGLLLVNGTLDLNGFTFSATNAVTLAGTKNLTFNGGSLVMTGVSPQGFSNSAPAGFTTTAGTGNGAISYTGNTTGLFTGGGGVYNCALNLGGNLTLTVTGSSTFNDITNTTQPAGIAFTQSTTNTFNNFSLSGTAGNLITIGTATFSSQHTLSKPSGTVSVNFCSISNSNATGGATWEAFTANGNVNGGNNTGWVFAGGVAQTGNFLLLF